MNIVLWIILGALAGWIASIITRSRQGLIVSIIVGVIGALIGGWIVQLLTGKPLDFGFNLISILVAAGGAVVLLLIIGLLRRR